MAKTQTPEAPEVVVPERKPEPVETRQSRGLFNSPPKAPEELRKGIPENWVPMADYCHGHTLSNALAFDPSFDNSLYSFRFFRAADEIRTLNGSMECGYWIPVHKTLELLNHTMEEVFLKDDTPGCPWDAAGYYPRGPYIKTDDGRECQELYLAVRPAAVNIAEQAIRVRDTAALLGPDSPALQAEADKARVSDPLNPNANLISAQIIRQGGPPPVSGAPNSAGGPGWSQFGYGLGQDPLARK